MENNKNSRVVILLLLILIAQLVTVGLGVDRKIQTRQERASLTTSVKQIQELTQLSQEALSDYQKNAYHNPQVNRIAEQQLLATETQMQQLAVLSMQLKTIGEMNAHTKR
ncbi:MAG: hypothetical protein Q7T82_20595 [Armatimonadota bacterium]|nr:hypothetical protein [Armatimonadota bacterium]